MCYCCCCCCCWSCCRCCCHIFFIVVALFVCVCVFFFLSQIFMLCFAHRSFLARQSRWLFTCERWYKFAALFYFRSTFHRFSHCVRFLLILRLSIASFSIIITLCVYWSYLVFVSVIAMYVVYLLDFAWAFFLFSFVFTLSLFFFPIRLRKLVFISL